MPDPDHAKCLLDLPEPRNGKEQQRIAGLFAYYAQWISRHSDKVKPLIHSTSFPLRDEALSSFQALKKKLAEVSLGVMNEDIPFVVETDTSDIAVSATLNQIARHVAFYSRSLNKSELNLSSVGKEATAIVEAVRKWSHLLTAAPDLGGAQGPPPCSCV